MVIKIWICIKICSLKDALSDTRRILIFLYLLRADLNELLMKAEATSPHYSPSFSARLSLPSPRRDGHERVAFRSLGRSRLSTRSISSFFFSRAFHSFSFLPLSRDLCPSVLSLPFDYGVRTTPASHNTRYPWRRVLSPFTLSLLLMFFRSRSTKSSRLFNSFAFNGMTHNRRPT